MSRHSEGVANHPVGVSGQSGGVSAHSGGVSGHSGGVWDLLVGALLGDITHTCLSVCLQQAQMLRTFD